jgi:hypothetical protein
MLIEVALDVGLVRELGGGLDAAADRHGGRASAGPMLVEVAPDVGLVRELGGGPVPLRSPVLPPARPNRVPTAISSLPRSLLFRGAVKRLDTPRNGQCIGTCRSRSSSSSSEVVRNPDGHPDSRIAAQGVDGVRA